ncbi:LacI family DNA-binding transcriptional regulator [Micromonospora sp. NPDC007271]|uniref:LacI family DNA-binding transcriptional regulator n=1 Tax=Micromonospora sp. NPDC007271 TaxID=3154587 RepID=UPI0033DBF436
MATIADVARAAGVHRSTVSRILRDPKAFRGETRARVLEAAARLDYRPSRIAQALSGGASPLVPLVVPDISNPFFARVARGAEEIARASGLHIVVCSTGGDVEAEVAYLQAMSDLDTPCILFTPSTDTVAAQLLSIARHTAVVLIDRSLPETDLRCVRVDHAQAAADGTQHLLTRGHRRVACVSGPMSASSARERIAGYRTVMDEAGLPAQVVEGDFTIAGGRHAGARLFAGGEPPTAVLAANDLCAVGLLAAARDAGLRVPDDVAVLGFDDLDVAQHVNPSLTTLRQPSAELGGQAARLALADAGLGDDSDVVLTLQAELIVRESA